MLRGRVASGDEPHDPSKQSDEGTYPERSAPTVMNHHVSDEWRREASAGTDAGEDPAVRNAALAHGNPARDELIGRRIDDRFARAQKKPDRHEDPQCTCNVGRDECGKSGEDSPPDHARSQHAAWAEAVGQAPSEGLEQCVTNQQRAEHSAQLDVAEMVGVGNRSAGGRNIDAIKVRHRAQNEQPEHQKPAHSSCALPADEGAAHFPPQAKCSLTSAP